MNGLASSRNGASSSAMRAGLLTGWSTRDRAEFARLLTKFTDAL
jgi:hypothetical protein